MWLTEMVSRKSLVLLLVGFMFAMAGLNLVTTQVPDEFFKLDPSVSAHLALAPVDFWAWTFTIIGFVAVAGALFRRFTPAGYSILMTLSTTWGALYLVSWWDTGYWRSIYGTNLYFLISGVLLITSGWAEIRHPLDDWEHHDWEDEV